ncbi:MAG TPA: LysM peptidoglycan-binding domain-containing protein, partial [Acidobacteriota bacterium]|nr:LysM peptidoglycan-binding domain-containing protein [Acidobacteriota bacterium]
MKTAWLKLVFGFMACFFLSYGICIAQTEGAQPAGAAEEQTQTATAEQAPAPPAVTSPERKGGELPPPLEAEMTIAEHWSKNPYPRSVAAGSRLHIVEKGDTLWDLANRYYNNPFLWPQIWDANKYIPNAHWIYPGDPITIPPLTPISEQQIAKETPTESVPGGGTAEGGPGGPTITTPEIKRFPIAMDTDLYCSGFIVKDTGAWKLRILGSEEGIQKVALSLFDVIYLNQGEAEGISPGDEFTVIHKIRGIEHPVSLAPLGDYVIQTGRVKVVATQEHTSTAQITFSCDATSIDDYLVPFEPKEVPLLSDLPPVDRFGPEGPNPKGYIVFAKDDLGSVGQNSEVQVDLGKKDGVAPGTRLVVYRTDRLIYDSSGLRHDLPRKVLGEIVIFNVQDATATGRIIQ